MKLENYLLKITLPDIGRKRNEHIYLHGVDSSFKEIYLEIKPKIKHGEFTKFIYSLLDSPKGTIDSWILGNNPIPILKFHKLLNLWKKMCGISDSIFNKKWDQIFKKTRYFSAWNSPKVILPKELNEEISYLCGFIIGDGHIKDEFKLKKRTGNAEYSISLYSNSKEFIKKLKILVFKNFNLISKTYFSKDKKGSWYTLRFTCKPIYRFFTECLRIHSGNRTGNAKVPEIVKEGSIEIKKSFISGFFDAEAGVGITNKGPWLEIGQLSYTNQSEILKWIKKTLNDYSIELNGPYPMSIRNMWKLRTASKKTINRFYKTISSRHPEKVQIYQKIGEFRYENRT